MEKYNTIFFIVIEIEILITLFGVYHNRKKIKVKKVDVSTTLTQKKIEDDLVIEKNKDLVQIDAYVEYIKSFIGKYQHSRNKKIAYRTRQDLLLETVKILPLVSKYIKLDYYYNLDDKEWSVLLDKDFMTLLETAYNDYSHDNLTSLNSIISASLRLRDDKR